MEVFLVCSGHFVVVGGFQRVPWRYRKEMGSRCLKRGKTPLLWPALGKKNGTSCGHWRQLSDVSYCH